MPNGCFTAVQYKNYTSNKGAAESKEGGNELFTNTFTKTFTNTLYI